MELSDKLELYAGTKIRFIEKDEIPADVILQDDGNGVFIKEWNVAGIKKPDIDKLQDYIESEYVAFFGDREKTIEERISKLETDIVSLEAK